MLHFASVCTPCCMLLDLVCLLLSKVWNRSNFSANNSQHFFCSVIAEALRNNVGSVCTALPTLLGPLTLITHGLQRLMGCILPTMHRRSQHCWELLHPFAHHCQHARTNSQHCWRNNVGSCCFRLHAAWGTTTATARATATNTSLKKVNSRCLKLNSAYSTSFNSSNVGKFLWSWILKDCIKVQEKKTKIVVLCSRPRQKRVNGNFHLAVVQRLQRNIQKKRNARAKLLFC